jgi:phosphoglycolate phosphatase-like HAD superfamily hydrolase
VPWPRERTVVIGDTPRDIACARADGVAVVAIATGPFGVEDLRDADAVVQHPSELPAALADLAG